MPTRNIQLTDHFDQFVESLVSTGRFEDASEVMRAGLRLLEEHAQEEERKLAVLRSLASEGFDALDRGEGIVIGSDDALSAFLEQAGRSAEALVNNRATGE